MKILNWRIWDCKFFSKTKSVIFIKKKLIIFSEKTSQILRYISFSISFNSFQFIPIYYDIFTCFIGIIRGTLLGGPLKFCPEDQERPKKLGKKDENYRKNLHFSPKKIGTEFLSISSTFISAFSTFTNIEWRYFTETMKFWLHTL